MTALAWVALAGILLAFLLYFAALRKAMKEGFTGRWIAYMVLAIFAIFILYLALNSSDIGPAEWAQILLMLGLVAVTGLYAMSAFRQAKASEKMAEATKEQADANVEMATEMKNQRYDTFRPVIDIQWQPDAKEKGLVRAAGVIAIEGGEPPQSQLPDKLTCVLINVGVGPATDVYSYIQSGTQPDDECHQLRPCGLLRVNEFSKPLPLSLKEMEDRKFLIVYYRDVHNRCFQSIREVSRDEKRGNLKLDPLGTSKLAQEVYSELNVGNYRGFLEKLWAYSTTGGILK